MCAVVLGLGAALFGWLSSMKQPPPAREPFEKVYNVEVFDVVPTDLREVISGFGTARADRQVVLAAQVAGRIVEVHPDLKAGAAVRPDEVTVGPGGESVRSRGDVLLTIDPTSYEHQATLARNRLAEVDAELVRLRQEQANNERLLAKAREDLETIAAEYDRNVELAERGVNTASQLARAKLEMRTFEDSIIKHEGEADLFPLRIAHAEKKRATHETDLAIALEELSRTRVAPPFAASISEVLVEQGQFVQPGTPLVRLTDTSRIEVPVPITLDEFARFESRLRSEDFPRVELAENVTAAARWAGVLVRAAPVADERTRTILVYVSVDNGSHEAPLTPGAFVHARISGPVLERAIVVPRDAIVAGQVFVATPEGRAERRAVEIRRTLQSLAQVAAGVAAGEQIVLTNLDVLYNGARVHVESHQALSDVLARQRVRVVEFAGDLSEPGP